MPPEDNQPEVAESGTLQPLQQYAELQFTDRETCSNAAPSNEFDVKYTKVCLNNTTALHSSTAYV